MVEEGRKRGAQSMSGWRATKGLRSGRVGSASLGCTFISQTIRSKKMMEKEVVELGPQVGLVGDVEK